MYVCMCIYIYIWSEAEGVTFRSSSPDEEALVAAARDYGFFFRKKVASQLTVNVRGVNRFYTVLICNEFSSDRKRMSVLIRRSKKHDSKEPASWQVARYHSDGDDELEYERPSIPAGRGDTIERMISEDNVEAPTSYCVEADDAHSKYPSILYVKGADNVMFERLKKGEMHKPGLKDHLKQFATHGLRTLICAKRELSPEETESFVRRMQEAQAGINDT